VVVIDSRKARDSRAVEEIGYYNPLEDPFVVNVDRERVTYWTERGAQVTDVVRGILKKPNSEHPTRRSVEGFEPEVIEKPKPKKAAKAGAKEEGGVAVATETAEAPTTGETAPKKKVAKKTTKKVTKKAEAKTAEKTETTEEAKPAEEARPEKAAKKTEAKPEDAAAEPEAKAEEAKTEEAKTEEAKEPEAKTETSEPEASKKDEA